MKEPRWQSIVALLALLVCAELWLLIHFGAVLAAITSGFVVGLGTATTLLFGKRKIAEVLQAMRDFGAWLVKTETLIALYILFVITALTVTTVHIVPEDTIIRNDTTLRPMAGYRCVAVRLGADAYEFVVLRLPKTSCAAQVSGYDSRSFLLRPWVKTLVLLGVDLPRRPPLLVRLPLDVMCYADTGVMSLYEGRCKTIDCHGVPAFSTTKGTAAVLIGTPQNRIKPEWDVELAAVAPDVAAYTKKAWTTPPELQHPFAPEAEVTAVFRAASGAVVAHKTIRPDHEIKADKDDFQDERLETVKACD